LIVDGFDLEKEMLAWALGPDAKSISQTFTFADFKQAFEFMTLCAQYAEEIDHHPDWSNSWNKVIVELSTHSVGGLTKLDIQLAKAMDAFAKQVKND
jgi:4a-hydroxytetrahydrobiopterin dehydratase